MSTAGDEDLERAQREAFAALTEVGRRLEAGRDAAAVDAARELVAIVRNRPDDPALPGFGAMALDAILWLIGAGRDAAALELCDAVVARMAAGAEADRGVAAGARLLAAQAAGSLGDPERARGHLDALTASGEPALAGLERMAGRLAAAGAAPAWHAQVAAATVAVLWRLGRVGDARVFARETAASFARLGEPELEARLTALDAEIAGAGGSAGS